MPQLVPSRRILLSLLGALVAACGASSDGTSNGTAQDILGDYSTPDPNNPWTKGQDLTTYSIGQENVLPNEGDMFAGMVQTINQMQDSLSSMNGGVARGFHAKPHACVLGEFHVAVPDSIPQARAGLFATDAVYPAWIRFSNGVGFTQSDKSTDVRGLAIKVMKVPGGTTQDFLMTNGPVTPAPSSQQFVDFGKAITDATLAGSSSPLGVLQTMLDTGDYLLRPENARVRWYLLRNAVPRVLKHGSILGEQFWSGGAISLGVDPSSGTPAQAIKFTALPGVVQSDGSCGTVDKLPDLFDDNYLRTDVIQRMQASDTCIDFRIQFQVDPARQPIEDTSVEWKEDDSPFTSVGWVRIPATDLANDPVAQQEEAFCNNLGFTPWHALPDHRPLGNIMRARQTVYDASRVHRGGADEPTGDETFSGN